MTVYAESSAVLAWLLGESLGGTIRETLIGARMVISSDLTLVECDRSLIRAVEQGRIAEGDAADARAALSTASSHWNLLRIAGEVIERARRPFPRESVRTLDALHLASALTARAAVGPTTLLSLDGRIRENGRELGFSPAPPLGDHEPE